MGVLHHIPAILFVICAATVAAFAVAVNKIQSAHDLYENHMKEPLHDAEHIFTWIAIVYFVLPMVAFIVVRDWTRTFFDCFSPLTLWLDALYSGVVVIQLIAFVGDIEENVGRIAIEYGGLVLQLSCVFSYTMLKQSNDPDFNLIQAIWQNILALLFLLSFGFGTLHQLQFKHEVEDGYESLAWSIAIIGMSIQALQPITSLAFRFHEGNFQNDETATKYVKIGAAILRLITLVYDVWSYTSRGFWDSPDRTPLATLACFSLVVYGLLVPLRYVGPEIIKAGIDASKARLQAKWISTKGKVISFKDRMKHKSSEIGNRMKNQLAAIKEWWNAIRARVMGQRADENMVADQLDDEAAAPRDDEAATGLAAGQHRNESAADRPLEQQFRALTIQEPTSLEDRMAAIRIE